MLEFLQKNGEWMSAIALVVFAVMQWWISRSQLKQDLRLRRLELSKNLDKAAVEFEGDRETSMPFIEWMAGNQSSFQFLLNSKDVKHVEVLYNFLLNLRRNTNFLNTQDKIKNVTKCNMYVNNLEVVLCNASYGIVKHKIQKESKSAK